MNTTHATAATATLPAAALPGAILQRTALAAAIAILATLQVLGAHLP